MQIFKKTPQFDFMAAGPKFAILSTVLVVASLVSMLTFGPKLGIDFAGGTEIHVAFPQSATSSDLRQALKEIGFPESEVVTVGSGKAEYLIRLQAISQITDEVANETKDAFKKAFPDAGLNRFDFSPGGDRLVIRVAKELDIAKLEDTLEAAGLELSEALPAATPKGEKAAPAAAGAEAKGDTAASTKRCESATCTFPFQDKRAYEVSLKGIADRVMAGLRAEPFGKDAVKMRSEWIGPKVGKQLRDAGIASLAYAILFIMLYVAVRFDIRFAPGGIIALMHDAIITLGVMTWVRFEVTLNTVAAVLTIIGYSINDTIVIFDRIREDMSKMKERDLSQVINQAVNETLSRTILTSLTVLLVLIALLIIGWNTSIREFAFAMTIGVIVGAYSTVFIASPIIIWLDKLFFRKKA